MEEYQEVSIAKTELDVQLDLVADMVRVILHQAAEGRTEREEYDENKDYGDDAEVVSDDDGISHVLRKVPRKYDRDVVYLVVDDVTRHYGGPQEGGWWYDSGEVVDSIPVLVKYKSPGGAPYLGDEEQRNLLNLADSWLSEYGKFGTNHRSSMAPRDRDLLLRATYDEPKGWSDYAPYC